MDKLKRILSNSNMIFLIEIFVLIGFNLFIYANIFESFFYLVLFTILIFSFLGNLKLFKPLIKKYFRIIVLINVSLIITLPIVFIYNLPKYSYSKAVKYIGDIEKEKGIKSFKYRNKKVNTIHGTNKSFLTKRDYLIETEQDGELYDYYFNPYTGQFKEMRIIPSASFNEYYEEYRILY